MSRADSVHLQLEGSTTNSPHISYLSQFSKLLCSDFMFLCLSYLVESFTRSLQEFYAGFLDHLSHVSSKPHCSVELFSIRGINKFDAELIPIYL